MDSFTSFKIISRCASNAKEVSVSVKVQIFETEAAFEALRGEWNTLLHHSPTDTVFLTWEWQSHWWTAYHPGELMIITVREDGGRLIGLAPWFIDTTEPEDRVVRGIGCIDVTDYGDIIADEAYFGTVMNALAAVLVERITRFTRLNLCNLRAISPTLTALREAMERAGFETGVLEQEVCPVIPLNRTFEQYLESLDKKNRHELRRKLRIAHGTPELKMQIITAEDDLDAAVVNFMNLMAESTEQKAAFLNNEQHVAFFRAIIPAMMANGWLQLAFLNYKGKPTAAYVNFVYNGRVMVYNSGLSLAHGHLSPGIILLCYLIQHACTCGCAAFDFLRGDEEYKFRMGGVAEPLYMLKARLA